MKNILHHIILSGCLLSPLGAAQAGPGTDRLHRFLDDTQTFQAHFEQALYDEDGVRQEVSSGEMFMQRPARFRWDYEQPYPQLIVADGEQIWLYDPELKQATVKPVKGLVSNAPGLLLGTGKPVEDDFVVREVGMTDELAWVHLVPRSNESQFSGVRLGFDAHMLVVMELHDNLGQVTLMRFTKQQTNGVLDKGLFSFEPPAGVDVIRAEQ